MVNKRSRKLYVTRGMERARKRESESKSEREKASERESESENEKAEGEEGEGGREEGERPHEEASARERLKSSNAAATPATGSFTLPRHDGRSEYTAASTSSCA